MVNVKRIAKGVRSSLEIIVSNTVSEEYWLLSLWTPWRPHSGFGLPWVTCQSQTKVRGVESFTDHTTYNRLGSPILLHHILNYQYAQPLYR